MRNGISEHALRESHLTRVTQKPDVCITQRVDGHWETLWCCDVFWSPKVSWKWILMCFLCDCSAFSFSYWTLLKQQLAVVASTLSGGERTNCYLIFQLPNYNQPHKLYIHPVLQSWTLPSETIRECLLCLCVHYSSSCPSRKFTGHCSTPLWTVLVNACHFRFTEPQCIMAE